MILPRRDVIAGGAAMLLGAPFAARARAAEPRVKLSGTMQQGTLVVGRAEGAQEVSVDGRIVTLSQNWKFAFGLGFDQVLPTQLVIRFTNGDTYQESITPGVRTYDEQVINGLPPETVEPPPEIQARIDAEHALVNEARKTNSDGVWFAEAFDWPVKGRISGVFGSFRTLNGVPGRRHFGIDIAAATGAPIKAPAGGIVLLAQEFFLEGGFTLIDHGQGVFTSYMHQSAIMVTPGELVRRGARIGSVGATGRATGPHLHWGMNWFQTRLDPSLSTREPAPDRA
jgi:murein DD-endopeptidase MepM/ murein hydrolase activator NlpD